MRTLSLLSASLVLAAAAGAQTVTVQDTLPQGFKSTEGAAYHWAGWRYAPARAMTLIPAKRINHTIKVYKGLRVRPNGTSTTAMSSKTLQLEVAMSDKGVVTTYPYYSTWSKHYGTNRTVVMVKKSISFPAATKPATPPHPWTKSVNLPFDKPWIHTGATTDGICVDVKFYSTTYNSTYWYADADYRNPKYGTGSIVGSGCPSTTMYSYVTGYYLGSTTGLYSYGYTRAMNDFALCFLGARQVAITIPGTQCKLYTIPMIWHPSVYKTTTSYGYAKFIWGQVQSSWVGVKAISQIVAVNTSFTIKALRAYAFQVGGGASAKYDQANLYGYGSTFNPDTSAAMYYSTYATIYGIY